jgi:pimeloyl-ACP methyl ester carboxylesterase
MRTMSDRSTERSEWTATPLLRVQIHARVWNGTTPAAPLVLVAGLGVSSRYWVRLGRRLAGERTVIAPDLPGFGRTPPPPGVRWPAGPDVREQADHLLAWMDARGIGRAVLCGHSVGCQTVVDLTTRCPHRVERVILAAPPFEPGRRSLAVSLPRLALGALFEVVSLPPLLGLEYGSAGPARAIQQAVRSMDYPMETRLPRIAVPTLVIHGQFDPLVSRRWAGEVARLVPRASLVVVEGVGHAMHYSAAAVTAAVVDRFLGDRLDEPVARDDPQLDPLGPPQPLSPAGHDRLNRAVGMAAIVLPTAVRVPAVIAACATMPGVPAVTRTALDGACGLAALLAAAIALRRQRRSVRLVAVMLGVYLIAVACLTAKPTGPARRIR